MRRQTVWIPLLAAAVLVVGSVRAEAYSVSQNAQQKALEYMRTANQMISSGRLTDGVKLIRLAINTNPFEPAFRMNYVKIMSKKGEQSILAGNRNEAIVVFRSVETELLAAAKLFLDAGLNDNAAHALAQVAQIYRHVYGNEYKARAYFNKAHGLAPQAMDIVTLAQGR